MTRQELADCAEGLLMKLDRERALLAAAWQAERLIEAGDIAGTMQTYLMAIRVLFRSQVE